MRLFTVGYNFLCIGIGLMICAYTLPQSVGYCIFYLILAGIFLGSIQAAIEIKNGDKKVELLHGYLDKKGEIVLIRKVKSNE